MSKVVAGNWKMNHGPRAARSYLAGFEPPSGPGAPRILLFPPTVSLAAAVDALGDTPGIELGVQDVNEAASGAFTGETSAAMAREAGAGLTLVGHSERRHIYGEDDARVAAKVGAAVEAGLVPVVCVGETLDERRAGRLEEVLLRQLDAVLGVLAPGTEWLLAYEPVWAIGTGETATPEDASEAHGILRRRVAAAGWSADAVPILYGGSVKPGNARELMEADGVDGVLVGGASLDPGDFAEIARAGSG
ncbi:MAG TPA: triose-phosphate isomerase [Longimicrobiales bacterium]|nr:triose-phosphate isomerase [Longimicrobiales bacterium]